MTKKAKRRLIKVQPGMSPTENGDDVTSGNDGFNTEATDLSAIHWTNGNMVRFWNGDVLAVGGGVAIHDNTSLIAAALGGVVSLIYNYYDDGTDRFYTIVAGQGGIWAIYDVPAYIEDSTALTFTNITPWESGTTTIANSLDTDHRTLANNPITTTNGSKTITVAFTSAGALLDPGESVTLSGCSGDPGGIPDAEINTTHTIVSTGISNFTVTVATTAATSATSGGGASVVCASGLIKVNATAHGLEDANRVKLASAADTGGILAAQINTTHYVRNKSTNAFYVMTAGTSTSAVSSGGGASTTYQRQAILGSPFLEDNWRDERMWSGGVFGDKFIACPGAGGKIYEWDGNTANAMTAVTNAPANNDHIFITDNIIVSLYGNTISWCDQGNRTVWTAAGDNQAGSDNIEGAAPFIGSASARGDNLIFTKSQVYRFSYIGPPYVFRTELLSSNDGLIGPHAAREYNGAIYWWGEKDFYQWRGGQVETIPNNTVRNLYFGDSGVAKSTGYWPWRHLNLIDMRAEYNEIWFHPWGYFGPKMIYNTAGFWFKSDDPDIEAAAKGLSTRYPLTSSSGILYINELYWNGPDQQSASAYRWYIESNSRQIGQGDNVYIVNRVIPDITGTDQVDLTLTTKLQPNDASPRTFTYTDIGVDGKIDTRAHGRQIKYKWQQDETYANSGLLEPFRLGNWYEEVIKMGSR